MLTTTATPPDGVAMAAVNATDAQEEEDEEHELTKKHKKKPRNKKPLLDAFLVLTDKDKDKFTLALEKDLNPKSKQFGQEFNCAQKVKLGDGADFDLKKLNLDQIHMLCTNLGIKNIGSHNLYQCHNAIGVQCGYAQRLEDAGLVPGCDQACPTNTICHAVNVCFIMSFYNWFVTLYNIKT